MNRTVFSLPEHETYRTAGGLDVSRAALRFTGGAALDELIELLDRRRGVVLSSGTPVPGRYESFDMGFADPPLVLETAGTRFELRALNPRGEVLIAFLAATLREPSITIAETSATRIAGTILRGEAPVDEEQRTRRASAMSLVRAIVATLASQADPLLGLYGAFAYDLVFQMEDLTMKRAREADQRDIVLYIPDRLLAYDRATGRGVTLSYDFAFNGKSTEGLPNATGDSVTRARRGRVSPITRRGNIRRRWKPRARHSRAAICSKRCRGSCSPNPATVRRPKCFSGCAASIPRPMAGW